MSETDGKDKLYTGKTPNHIVRDMYLEINSISQGLNIGLLVLTLATTNFYQSFTKGYFTLPVFAVSSLIISVIFWVRYYFDTEILNRSYTVLSVIWFFAYIISQGVSISFVNTPTAWLLSTGVFLFFGFGFYALNLSEMRRKEKAGALSLPHMYMNWQNRRMLELVVLSVMAFCGAYLATQQPILALPISIVVLMLAIWQLKVTNDYRDLQFIETGA